MKKAFVIALVVFGSAFAKAQSPSYQALVMEYFEVGGIDEEYNQAYDMMLNQIKDAFQSQSVPESFWKKHQNNKKESVAQFKGILAAEYRSIITEKYDLEQLIKFYKSEAGIQLRKNPAAMTEEQKAAYAKYLESSTAQKINEIQGDLSAAKQRTSMYWSRNLFCSIISEIKELGYNSGMPTGNCN
ncbi:DUF2059 domain-containing protein [Nonlabens sp. SCSIO 43208]|uniref:DUF2059 domain-containing protein n=1 Tax=Nonlabens sp. SCSIO 43208 TaxID=2793009 RepID=UPI003D6A6AFA